MDWSRRDRLICRERAAVLLKHHESVPEKVLGARRPLSFPEEPSTRIDNLCRPDKTLEHHVIFLMDKIISSTQNYFQTTDRVQKMTFPMMSLLSAPMQIFFVLVDKADCLITYDLADRKYQIVKTIGRPLADLNPHRFIKSTP